MITVLNSKNETIGFPDYTDANTIKNVVDGDVNGTISQAKPNWYKDKVQPLLEKSGMDMFQPKFVSSPKPEDITPERAFVAPAVKEASFGLFDVTQNPTIAASIQKYPAQKFAGNLVGQFGAIFETFGIGEAANIIKEEPALTGFGENIVNQFKIGALYSAIRGGTEETKKAIDTNKAPDLVEYGQNIANTALQFGIYGGEASAIKSIPVATASIMGTAYGLAKLNGDSEQDAVLQALVMGTFHIANSSTSPKVHEASQEALNIIKRSYIKSISPLVPDQYAEQFATEHEQNIKDEINTPAKEPDKSKIIPETKLVQSKNSAKQDIINKEGKNVGWIINHPEEGIVLHINEDSKLKNFGTSAVKNIFDNGVDSVTGDVGKLNDEGQKFWKKIGGKLVETDSGNYKLYLSKDDFYNSVHSKLEEISKQSEDMLNITPEELDSKRKEQIIRMGKMSGEIGSAYLPVEEIAQTVKETINLLYPRAFVPKEALDEIMKMKGGQDKSMFELETKLRKVTEAMDKWDKEKQISFIDNIKLGNPQENEALDKLAKMMRDTENLYWKEAKKFKDSLAYKENHYRVLWKKIPGSQKAKGGFKGLFRRPLQGSKGFIKQSTLESMSEGIALGGEPYTYNPMVMWQNAIMDMQKFITAQRMFASMKDMGYAKFVKTGGDIPEGYVALDDNIAKAYFPTDQGLVKSGEYYMEENVARILNNFVGRDFIRSSKVGSALLKLKNVTTALELSLSPFHAAYVSLATASSSIGLGVQKIVNRALLQQRPQEFLDGLKDILTAGTSPISYSKTGGKAIKMIAQDEFEQTPEGKEFLKQYPDAKQLIDDLFTGGGKLAMHQDYKINSLKAFQEGIKNKDPWAVGWSSIPAANELIMKPLFEMYIPRLKIGMFLKEYSLELKQRSGELAKGSISRAELSRKVWDNVENRLGEMNFDNLFWNRNLKTGLQLAFRSVTWKIGALRNIGQALPEQIMEIKKAYDDGRAPLLTSNVSWLLGVSTLATVFSYVTMGMMGQGQPQNLTDIIAPTYDKEGNRISLNTHIKDWVHIWHSPLGFITNSLSGEIGRVVDVWKNKDFFGVEIYHPDDSEVQKSIDIIKHLFPTPFSITNQMKLKGGNVPGTFKITTALGLTQPSPSYVSNTPALEKAYEIMQGHFPAGARTKQQFEKSKEKSQLRESYGKTGDISPLDKAFEEGEITQAEETEIKTTAKMAPLERTVRKFSIDEVLKVMKKANKKELKLLVPIAEEKLQKKIDAGSLSEEEYKQLGDELNKYEEGKKFSIL